MDMFTEDVVKADDEGLRAIISAAAREGNLERLTLAMDHAASSRGAAYVASVLQPESMSPLMMAALSGSTGCILLLLQRGAVVDHENDIRSTALHYAAWRGHYAAVKVLLEHGACVDVADNNGNTPMHDLCGTDCRVHMLELLKLLLRHGSRASRISNQGNKLPVQLLIGHRVVCSETKLACAKLLVAHGGFPYADLQRYQTDTWQWLHDAADARARTGQAAMLLLAFRRFKRSAMLSCHDMEIVRLIAQHVWAARMH